MINKFIGIGYIGKKGVDLRFTTGKGTAIGNFTLSVEKRMKNKEGKKEYNFINCVCWGKQAEFLANKTNDIKKVAVEGELVTFTYDKKDGGKGYGWNINCNDVQVVEWSNSTSNNSSNDLPKDAAPVDMGEIPF